MSIPSLDEIRRRRQQQQQQQQQQIVCSFADRDLLNIHRNDKSFKQILHEKLHIQTVRLDSLKIM
jgi:hypothetical protein